MMDPLVPPIEHHTDDVTRAADNAVNDVVQAEHKVVDRGEDLSILGGQQINLPIIAPIGLFGNHVNLLSSVLSAGQD